MKFSNSLLNTVHNLKTITGFESPDFGSPDFESPDFMTYYPGRRYIPYYQNRLKFVNQVYEIFFEKRNLENAIMDKKNVRLIIKKSS